MPAWTSASIGRRLSAQPSPGALALIKVALCVLCLAPAGLMVWDALAGELGANPVETLIHRSGTWALRFLLITLAITPLRQFTGAAWLIRLRRMLGLYAFFYVCVHFLVFTVFEHSLEIAAVLEDVAERPFILVGFVAFLLLIPLAVTSTNGWMRRLGKRWKRLHRLVYAIALLAVIHFFLLTKADDYREPAIYAAMLVLLLLARALRRGA